MEAANEEQRSIHCVDILNDHYYDDTCMQAYSLDSRVQCSACSLIGWHSTPRLIVEGRMISKTKLA